jgi:hypothetical protein
MGLRPPAQAENADLPLTEQHKAAGDGRAQRARWGCSESLSQNGRSGPLYVAPFLCLPRPLGCGRGPGVRVCFCATVRVRQEVLFSVTERVRLSSMRPSIFRADTQDYRRG